jgi:GMP synthase-like glutamine amidotransferase
MRLHYLQHVPFEDAGHITDWARDRGHHVSHTRLDLNEPLPDLDSFDWLVVLGGPMSVRQQAKFPWLAAEKEFIRAAIGQGSFLLGICLGGQLAAEVLGGRVTRNPCREIGWFQVALTAEGKESPCFRSFPSRFLAFQWHGETFSIPPGAVRAAWSPACQNQAFLYEDRVIGLQFHLEYTGQGIQRMVQNCGRELLETPTIQKAEEILSHPERITRTHELLERMLDTLEHRWYSRLPAVAMA